tara:strand:- start:862 stop:2343 length:1482 start_codon:yes stop_codon:yes gene_type:complete
MIRIKKTHDKILTKRGYAIKKEQHSEQKLAQYVKELSVKPFVNNSYGNTDVQPYPIYLESKHKLYLPKFYGFSEVGEPTCIKLSRGREIDIQFQGTLRPKQIPVVDCFIRSCAPGLFTQQSNGGIISVPCGWGKTIMALYIAAQLKRKTLIIVHKEFLLNQWKDRICEFLPGARVGTIQGPTVDTTDKDIVIGMLQSLSIKKYSAEIFDDFGFTIVDECHHIAAEVFCRALPKVNAYYSLGLSATPKRSDGLGKVFNLFLGPMVYKCDTDEKVVDVRVIHYSEPNNIAYNREEKLYNGRICMPKMVNNIVDNPNRNRLIVYLAKYLVSLNKQVIILSDRRRQLTFLYEMLSQHTKVGYYMGGLKRAELVESESANVILGTYAMSSEGLDIPSLDAAIFATPKSSIQQSIGRITRKKHTSLPIAFDIVDTFSVFTNQYKKRLRLYKKLSYSISQTSILVHDLFSPTLIENALHNLQSISVKKKKKTIKCLIEDN